MFRTRSHTLAGRPGPAPARSPLWALLSPALALLLALGCSSRQEPPRGEVVRGGVPDLRGRSVMVFPVQESVGVDGSPDAEIAYALQRRGPAVDWVLPERLVETARRSPTLGVNPRALAVGIFLQGEIQRIGDPLFRDLLQMAALTGSDLALLPVRIRYPGAAGGGSGGPAPGGEGARPMELTAALVNTRNGQVFWFGILQAPAESGSDPRALAELADRLARSLVPGGG